MSKSYLTLPKSPEDRPDLGNNRIIKPRDTHTLLVFFFGRSRHNSHHCGPFPFWSYAHRLLTLNVWEHIGVHES